MNDGLGKQAEQKIREWLDRPEDGYCFDRIPDQMNGFYGSKNVSDFTLYKSPNFYYIESKATWNDRFDFSAITQIDALMSKSIISGVKSVVIVLFASYKRAFIIDIREIDRMIKSGIHSANIKKIDKWKFEYQEIRTIPNARKKLLDYDTENNIL